MHDLGLLNERLRPLPNYEYYQLIQPLTQLDPIHNYLGESMGICDSCKVGEERGFVFQCSITLPHQAFYAHTISTVLCV